MDHLFGGHPMEKAVSPATQAAAVLTIPSTGPPWSPPLVSGPVSASLPNVPLHAGASALVPALVSSILPTSAMTDYGTSFSMDPDMPEERKQTKVWQWLCGHNAPAGVVLLFLVRLLFRLFEG